MRLAPLLSRATTLVYSSTTEGERWEVEEVEVEGTAVREGDILESVGGCELEYSTGLTARPWQSYSSAID